MVGVTDSPGNLGIQLQRVVSRCKAEFFYVSYGDTALDDVEASVAGVCKMSGKSSFLIWSRGLMFKYWVL